MLKEHTNAKGDIVLAVETSSRGKFIIGEDKEVTYKEGVYSAIFKPGKRVPVIGDFVVQDEEKDTGFKIIPAEGFRKGHRPRRVEVY